MASNYEDESDRSVSDFSDSDTDVELKSDSESDSDSANQQVCKYYNKKHCRNGTKCPYLHICRYFLKGNCRYGASCRLNHILETNPPSDQRSNGRKNQGRRERRRSSSSDSDSDSSKPYKWQLDLGNGWEDVANDYILEAQFSRPNTKGIKLYNTPCGVLSIDFTRMRILKKKNLRVRRKGSQQSDWLWYYRGNRGWHKYGNKDAQGNVSPVDSNKLESEFQKNPHGTVPFTINGTNYEIRFKGMRQENMSTGHKRKIRRRPKYVSTQSGGKFVQKYFDKLIEHLFIYCMVALVDDVTLMAEATVWKVRVNALTKMLGSLRTSTSKKTALWQFNGRGGNWHNFKSRDSCSLSSANIEAEFQRNPQGTMNFTVRGDQYKLDFSQMIQTNMKTQAIRHIRRVMQ